MTLLCAFPFWIDRTSNVFLLIMNLPKWEQANVSFTIWLQRINKNNKHDARSICFSKSRKKTVINPKGLRITLMQCNAREWEWFQAEGTRRVCSARAPDDFWVGVVGRSRGWSIEGASAGSWSSSRSISIPLMTMTFLGVGGGGVAGKGEAEAPKPGRQNLPWAQDGGSWRKEGSGEEEEAVERGLLSLVSVGVSGGEGGGEGEGERGSRGKNEKRGFLGVGWVREEEEGTTEEGLTMGLGSGVGRRGKRPMGTVER